MNKSIKTLDNGDFVIEYDENRVCANCQKSLNEKTISVFTMNNQWLCGDCIENVKKEQKLVEMPKRVC